MGNKALAIFSSATDNVSATSADAIDNGRNGVFQETENPIVFSSCFSSKTNGQRQVKATTTTTLIILNYPIPPNSFLLRHLWDTSNNRIAADGGANRLYEFSKDLIPDRIRGDLDSLDPTVRAYYEDQNVSVEQDFCQDTNDLDKALQVLVDGNSSSDETIHHRVVIYGAFGGRFDQEMASFAALYKWAPLFRGQVYLYSDETCAFLIPAKRHCEIRFPLYDRHTLEQHEPKLDIGEGPTCGLIPLGCPCASVVTSGLKWDLDGSLPLEFGGLVSTSNRIMKPSVEVFASHPLVFTAELVSKQIQP